MHILKLNQVEEQADQLMVEAKRKLLPKGFFQSFFSSHRQRVDDAIDCYQRGGNLYKLAKKWSEAAQAFQMAASLHSDYENRVEAAHNFVLAAKCYEKYDVKTAIDALNSAIEIYTELGRISMAAKLHFTIASIFEDNLDLVNAIRHFEQSADLYNIEDNFANAKRAMLKVAEYSSADFYNYERALDIFQEIGFADMKNPVTQYGAKEILLKALLCHLAIDALNAKHALGQYANKFPVFNLTKEYDFIAKLIDQIEEENEAGFNEVVSNFSDLTRSKSWYSKLLYRIKRQILDKPDLM